MKLKVVQKSQDNKTVVYKIKYNDCAAVCLIETQKNENEKLREHQRAVDKKRKKKNHICDHY